jgi:hypothetical protein
MYAAEENTSTKTTALLLEWGADKTLISMVRLCVWYSHPKLSLIIEIDKRKIRLPKTSPKMKRSRI